MNEEYKLKIKERVQAVKDTFRNLEKPIRIFLTGPSASGKTTLARKIAEEFGIELVPSIPREVLKMVGDDGKPLFTREDACGKGGDHYKTVVYQRTVQEKFNETISDYYRRITNPDCRIIRKDFVCDRHGVDYLAYEEMFSIKPERKIENSCASMGFWENYAPNYVFSMGPNDKYLTKARNEDPDNEFVKKDSIIGFIKIASKWHKKLKNVVFPLQSSPFTEIDDLDAKFEQVLTILEMPWYILAAEKPPTAYYQYGLDYSIDGNFKDIESEWEGVPKLPGLLSDFEIKNIFSSRIVPFDPGTRVPGMISSGLSSGGYDFKLGEVFKAVKPRKQIAVFNLDGSVDMAVDPRKSIIDPLAPPEEMKKNFEDLKVQADEQGRKHVVLEPLQCVLAETEEYIDIPDDVLIVLVGKSTYARCFVMLNTTPLEPGWRGKITLEITNASCRPVKLYIGQGIAQGLFFRMTTRAEKPYTGAYQDQKGLEYAKIRE